MKNIKIFIRYAILCCLINGCAVDSGGPRVSISHNPLAIPTQKFSENLYMEAIANDQRTDKDRIGNETFTIFAIPINSVKTSTDLKQQVSDQIREALEAIGYRVFQVENSITLAQKDALMLSTTINKFWFKNYTWLSPFTSAWGDIDIRLTLKNSTGNILFEKSFQGAGSSSCFRLFGPDPCFDKAVKDAMTNLLNQVINEFSNNKIHNIITPKEP